MKIDQTEEVAIVGIGRRVWVAAAAVVIVGGFASGCGSSGAASGTTTTEASAVQPAPYSTQAVQRTFARCRLPLLRGIVATVATELTLVRQPDQYDRALQIYVFGSTRSARAYLTRLPHRQLLSHHRADLTSKNVIAFYDTRMRSEHLARLRASMATLRHGEGRCAQPT